MDLSNTKEVILQTAIDMFSEKGFSNVSMRDLAKQVGITPASIYNHFSSKDEIMSQILELYHLKSLKLLYYSDEDSIKKMTENKTFDELMSDLFQPFNPEEAEEIRKMCKILIVEQYNHPKAIEFWSDLAIVKSVRRVKMMLDIMTQKNRIPQNNTLLAAELIIRTGVTYLIQFTHYQNGDDTPNSMSMYNLYSIIFDKIKKGELQ